MSAHDRDRPDFGIILADDPGFTEGGFRRRVEEAFLAIQDAWSARDMAPAHRYLSDTQYTVLDLGVREYLENGTINRLEGWRIDDVEPLEVVREGGADTVLVRITATCVDYTVDEKTGEVVNPEELGDGKTPSTFEEYWVFERSSDAKTGDAERDWALLRIEQV